MVWFRIACILVGMTLIGMIIDPFVAAGFTLLLLGTHNG